MRLGVTVIMAAFVPYPDDLAVAATMWLVCFMFCMMDDSPVRGGGVVVVVVGGRWSLLSLDPPSPLFTLSSIHRSPP